MDDQFQIPKQWWKSRTIIGLVISIATKVGALAGYEIGLDQSLPEILLMSSFIGDAIAGYGRAVAQGPLQS